MKSHDSSPAQPEMTADVPWNPWLGVLYILVAFVVVQLLAGVLVSLFGSAYLFSRHWTAAHVDNWLNTSIPMQFIYILLAEALSVAAVYAFVKHYKLTLRAIGLKRPRWVDPVYALAAVVPYFLAFSLLAYSAKFFFSGLNLDQTQQVGFSTAQGGGQLLLTFIALVILPPLAEEIMVRGFLYSSLKKALPGFWAVILTSALFAAAHLPEGGSAGPLYVGAIETFVLSLFLIYLREKTHSLWPGIWLHALNNTLAFVTLFATQLR